jgi:large subunit ribosomal protein L30
MATKYFKVKQVHSALGRLPIHIRTIEALGLTGPGSVKDLPDTPQVRGMITKVQYLLQVTPVQGQLEKKPNPVRKLRRDLAAKKKKAK